MAVPFMVYFGPWDRPGHYMYYETGELVLRAERQRVAWQDLEIDGVLQPGCRWNREHPAPRRTQVEGEALLHHKRGWTALSFWDSTIDERPGCSSTYIAEGTFTFDEMVALAKARFAARWNKMKFQVVLALRTD